MYVIKKNDFDLWWQKLQNKYDFINDAICIYLINEIISKKRQWCKIWIDQKMHFNNHTFFKSEDDHIQLKIELKSFTNDLMSIIKKTNRRCDRIKSDYINKLKNEKQRLNHQLRKSLFRDLMIYVISHVLKSINEHYTRLLNAQKKNVNLSSCTKSFRRIMNLSCAHDIERRFVDAANEKVLKLENVHFHWRYHKSNNRHYSILNIFVKLSNDEAFFSDSLLQIQNSRKIKIKERSTEASNKVKKNEIERQNNNVALHEKIRQVSNTQQSLISFRRCKCLSINRFSIIIQSYHFRQVNCTVVQRRNMMKNSQTIRRSSRRFQRSIVKNWRITTSRSITSELKNEIKKWKKLRSMRNREEKNLCDR